MIVNFSKYLLKGLMELPCAEIATFTLCQEEMVMLKTQSEESEIPSLAKAIIEKIAVEVQCCLAPFASFSKEIPSA